MSVCDVTQDTPLDLSKRGRFTEASMDYARLHRRLPCPICDKNFDRPSLLKRHLRTHTGEKPHGCTVCGKMFSTSSSLNTHARIHTGERPHECPICGKRFTASSNLYYHRMTHYKEKPHKCTDCGRSFPTPGDLKAHKYSHTGDWPLRCPICNRGFCKPGALSHHVQLHNGNLRTNARTHNLPLSGLPREINMDQIKLKIKNTKKHLDASGASQIAMPAFPWISWYPLQYAKDIHLNYNGHN
ncbi:oocyte zinc finger protein XlCOF19-like [Prorops nasuta]|uniref:oocyte zinc finger protein XlCOF19-like n=1 Tax=Prorops nasuta TaxID=863751 RepID=UPI0034D00DEE